jgi:ABC-type proline/glycine betaine transport system ATPase subunit
MDITLTFPNRKSLGKTQQEAIKKLAQEYDLREEFDGEPLQIETIPQDDFIVAFTRDGNPEKMLEATHARGVACTIHCDATMDSNTYEWNHKCFTLWMHGDTRQESPAGCLSGQPLIPASEVLQALENTEKAAKIKALLQRPIALGLVPTPQQKP